MVKVKKETVNTNKKRVLFVVSSLNTGGAQRIVSNITSNFPEDWEIDILLNSSDNITYPYKGNIISLKMKEPKNRASISYQLRVFIKRYFRLRQLKKDGNYRACISFLTSANAVNIVTGNKRCKTVISTRSCLSIGDKLFRGACLRRAFGKLFNRADLHVAITEGVKIDLCDNFNCTEENIRVIYNGFNLNEIVKKSTDESGNLEDYDIVTVGRLTPQKNQWHLIRCIKEIKKKYPDIRCLIMGEGEDREYLERLIREGNLQENVFLSGFVNNPYPQLARAKMFVFPSAWEGFGNVVIEAMSLGVPCILSDYRYGAREIIAPGWDIRDELIDHIEFAEYGILTPVCSGRKYEIDDPLEKQEVFLCEAIDAMIKDEVRARYREKGFERINKFSIESIVTQWIEEIER